MSQKKTPRTPCNYFKKLYSGRSAVGRRRPNLTFLAVDVDFARREERAALLLHDVPARKPYKNKARPPLVSSTCGFCLARPLSEVVGGSFPPYLLHQVYRRAGPDRGPPAAPQRPSAGRRGSLRGPPGAPQWGGPTAGASAGDGRRCRSPRSASSARQRGGRAGRERGVRRRSCGSAAGVGGSGTPLPARRWGAPPPPLPTPRRPAGHGSLPAAPLGVLPLPGGGRGV